MPYNIRKLPNQSKYKVYKDGRALSKKGLSLKTAKAQKTAVILSELRKKNRK